VAVIETTFVLAVVKQSMYMPEVRSICCNEWFVTDSSFTVSMPSCRNKKSI
jgi:hypothetical protein